MAYFIPFVVVGLVSGSVYGMAGVGLVLTYKVSGIFNFAYGAMATMASYLFYALNVQSHIPLVPSVLLAVLGLGILLGFGFERLSKVVSQADLPIQVAATIGVLLIVEALANLIYGADTLEFPTLFPTQEFKILGTYISVGELIIFGVSIVSTVVLYVFLRRARLGKAMRAVVDNPVLLDLAGTNPTRVRRWAWIIGCVLATLAGLLLAPSVGLNPTTLTLLVAQAFGAAAIGRFSSLPLTWAGGLLIGIATSLITGYVNSESVILAGLAPSLPFIILFVVILFSPKRNVLSRVVTLARSQAPSWSAPTRMKISGGVLVLAFLLLVPLFAGFRIAGWTSSLTDVIVLLSLGLLVRESGQVSLCQVALAAVGAAVFSHLAVGAGVPWLLALFLSGLAVVPLGALLAIPAMRLGGLFFALSTFGFGLLMQSMFYQSGLMFGDDGITMPLPKLGWLAVGTPDGFYYVVLLFTILFCLAALWLHRSRSGRLLRGITGSELAMTVSGTSVDVTYVLVFCLSSFMAGIAGALSGMDYGVVNGLFFDPSTSLVYLTLIVITVGGVPWYALMAGAGLGLVPSYISGNSAEYLQLIFGATAIQVAILGIPHAPAWLRASIDRWFAGSAEPSALARRATNSSPTTAGQADVASLEICDLSVQFGGVRAVDMVSLRAESGHITGLIGPNGAGKTTTFNVCSGFVRPRSGRILFNDRDISRRSPAARARLGLGRTFQQMQLFDSLTVAETVALGREAAMAGGNPLTQIVTTKSERGSIEDNVREVIELCGIEAIADVKAGNLSTGQRRLVEVARCLAGPFNLLLLDEPCAGLDGSERRSFAAMLHRIVETRGVGILLVEHDMSFVMDVCEHIYVMDFGRLIFEGTAKDVADSPIVQEAYLGSAPERAGES